LQWLHSLERLGHRVFFVEFLRDKTAATTTAIEHFQNIVEQWWYPDRAALVLEPSMTCLCGPGIEVIKRTAGQAAALITLAAHYRREPFPLLERIRPRILIEQDPAYTHLWAAGGDPADVFGKQDLYYTVGGNISSSRCSVPTLGIRWRPIYNPVLLDWWPLAGPPKHARFTTVADWRSYGYLEFEGQVLGPKAEEFRKFLHLPRRVGEELEIALEIDPEDPDRNCLREHGWRIETPAAVATPERYRTYITSSVGEFSCAKGGYVGTRCGWFSDRSACYLAAGRPVVLQATGFEDLLPTGQGLCAFKTIEEATEALKAIRSHYAHHSMAARAIAQEYLAGEQIVQRLLTEAELGGTGACPSLS
ncbi:MAG TPA: hypothetical protein VFA18_11650, partial [Gemmataceae bacterium]|nr:hypothetical protein [Gemmataceae bacterium]